MSFKILSCLLKWKKRKRMKIIPFTSNVCVIDISGDVISQTYFAPSYGSTRSITNVKFCKVMIKILKIHFSEFTCVGRTFENYISDKLGDSWDCCFCILKSEKKLHVSFSNSYRTATSAISEWLRRKLRTKEIEA